MAFKVFSGNGQDGILLYLLTILDIKHHTIIDIGCGNGISGNSANLIINHGFSALLIDGDQARIQRGINFYSRLRLLYNNHPHFLTGRLNNRNVDPLISSWLSKNEVDEFTREWAGGLLYGGASLAAFNKILRAKGYWLIGCDPSGFDAYFIREGESIFPEVSLQLCYETSKVWQNTYAKSLESQLSQRVWIDI